MLETIEGRGKLEDWDVPKVQMPVVYRFQIRTEILSRPGFPPVAARKHSIGLVQTHFPATAFLAKVTIGCSQKMVKF